MFSQSPAAPSSQDRPAPPSTFRPRSTAVVDCPICSKQVRPNDINAHLDAGCATHIVDSKDGKDGKDSTDGKDTASTAAPATTSGTKRPTPPPSSPSIGGPQKRSASSFFQTPLAKRQNSVLSGAGQPGTKTQQPQPQAGSLKRSFDEGPGGSSPADKAQPAGQTDQTGQAGQSEQNKAQGHPAAKRSRSNKAAPLAERMRPQTLDEVHGQDLVGRNGVLRSLIEADRVPSMILWGGSGTGKTTIARCIAQQVGSRFVEMNATSSGGVAECKKLFQDAANELSLTGRRTILFCDEIHRFTKAQQDVFLKPVEAGTITLIGATTENPSFRIVNALLSRCRTFTLAPLTAEDVVRILERAVEQETGVSLGEGDKDEDEDMGQEKDRESRAEMTGKLSPLIDRELLQYLANFADGDARTALNLLELAMSIAARPQIPSAGAGDTSGGSTYLTKQDLKASLTKTLVYDRAGDQHYDTISAFHKSVRGSDPDATLYYLARMLQSGEDPLFIARRMVVIASEDVGLADNSLLTLATSAYTAAQQIGMPEARIPLAHCAVALALAPKSTRAYRGLNNAFAALREPGVASLPIPIHLRNAPTRLMKDLGYGKEYKYNPNYLEGRVRQDYLPDQLLDRTFLEARDLGTAVDADLQG